ncbi:RAS1 protein [Dimargaris xerosporica]|nr:RAS1 protein [Dimargaris xerosporica]
MPVQPSKLPQEFKVVILGAGGVGKSALTIRFVRSYFIEEYDPTIEDSYVKTCTIDDEDATLDVLDSAGQEEYSAMREQYMRGGDGFILVYSITSRSGLDEVRLLADQLRRVKELDEVPMVIVGNKCDLAESRQVSTEEGRQLALHYQALFLESSAKTRTNVDEAFHGVVRQIRSLRNSAHMADRSPTSANSHQGLGGHRHRRTLLSMLAFARGNSATRPASDYTTLTVPPPVANPARMTAKEAYYQESQRRAQSRKSNMYHEDHQSHCCTIF